MCHVLIIEDEAFFALDLQALLEEEGATSFSFADSEEGAISAALAHPPALITSDVKLLEGTGPCAISTIHERLGNIPVLFITGTPQDCQPCNPPGRVFAKPFDRDKVRKAFHEMLGH